MKTLFTTVSFTIASVICFGQSEKEKSVYSMKKDSPVIYEEKSELKMDSTDYQSRTSVSMYKNSNSPDVKDSVIQNSEKKDNGNETILKSEPKKEEIERK